MPGLVHNLKNAWNLAVTVGLAEAGILVERRLDRFRALPTEGLQGILTLAVFITSMFWFLDYMLRTKYEMGLFEEVGILDRVSRIGGVNWDVSWVAIPLAAGFGWLLAEVVSPINYCVIASSIQIADAIGLSIIQRNFFRAREKAVDFDPAFYEFYFYTPQSLHRTLKVVGFMLALLFAVAAQLSHKTSLTVDSSILVIATIVIGEVILAVWRHRLHVNQRVPNTLQHGDSSHADLGAR